VPQVSLAASVLRIFATSSVLHQYLVAKLVDLSNFTGKRT